MIEVGDVFLNLFDGDRLLVMSLNFPSGLVVYWLVSTVLTILQQQVTTRITGAPVRAKAK